MVKKLLGCPHCGKSSSQLIDKEQHPVFKKMEMILKSNKTAYEKKIALFNWLKSLDVGKLQSEEDQRINSLLLSRLYNELTKQSMKEYKKKTAEIFSKENDSKNGK